MSGPRNYFLISIAMIVLRTLSAIGGIAVVLILAAKYGLSADSDAYFMARMVPVTLVSPIAISFNLAFVPIYMRARRDGGLQAAGRFTSGFLNLTLLASLGVTLLYMLFADGLIVLLAPGLDPEAREAAVLMTRIMAPAMLLLCLYSVLDSVLNAERNFLASATSSLAVPVGAILGVTVLGDLWGAAGLAIGVVAGFVVQALLVLPLVPRYLKGYRLRIDSDNPTLRRAAKHFGFSVLVVLSWQIVTAVDRMLGSLLGEGAISALSLGGILIAMIPVLVAAPVYKVLYPELVTLVEEDRQAALRRLFIDNFLIVSFLTFPIALGLAIFAPLVAGLEFSAGRFDAVALTQTTDVILYRALGLPAGVAGLLLVYYFVVTERWGLILRITIATVIVNTALAWLLMQAMGLGGIALGNSIMTTLRTLVLAGVMGRLLHGSVTRGLATPLLKCAASAAVACAVMYAGAGLLDAPIRSGQPALMLACALGLVLAGACVYLLCSILLRHEVIRELDRYRGKTESVGGLQPPAAPAASQRPR